jgi:6-pyruvoyltetrahydropterin/6-carboxytetrahydropterin synthase
VKHHLRALADRLDHENINDLEPFTHLEPSAENQAKYFYDELQRLLPKEMRDSVLYVRVWETPTQWAQYTERTLFV